MPARSFAIDAWASRLLFLGVTNGHLRLYLENHRCSARGHTFQTRWQLGPEFCVVDFQCVNCSQIEGMAVRTPFSLYEDPVAQYLQEGWPELNWDSVIASWQLAHRAHVDTSQFSLSRSFSNGRIFFTLACLCGSQSPPSAGWNLEGSNRIPTSGLGRPTAYHPSEAVLDLPKVIKSAENTERLVRHRASGRIYKLPAFTIHLEPVEGEAQSLSCSVENLWAEYDRFYGGADTRKYQTWHERLAKE